MPGPKLNITDFVRGKIISHPPVACVLEMVSYSEHVLSLPFFVSFFFLSLYFLFFLVCFLSFPPNCGCTAILLDSDPSDKSILLAKLWLPLSGECERAAMSHLRDLFSFLPLSWIKPCTCP